MSDLPIGLNNTLISLLQSLGLFSQATNIKETPFNHNMTSVDLVEALSKFDLKFSVLTKNEAKLDKIIYPFVVMDEQEGAYIVRRKSNSFEKLMEDKKWEGFSLTGLTENEYLITIDSIPMNKKKGSVFASLLAKRKKWLQPVFWLSLLSSLAGLSVPLFTMVVYNKVIGGQTADILPGIAFGGAIALVILVGSRLLRAKVVGQQSTHQARDMSSLSFHQLINMPFNVLSRVSMASHLARIRNAEKIRTLLSGHGGAGLIDLPFTLIVFFVIMAISGWLVLVPILMLSLYYLIMMAIDKYVQAAMPTISIEYQDTLNELSEKIIHLKSSGYTETWMNNLFRLSLENTRQNFIYAKRNGLNAAVSQGLSMLTTLATVFAGIFLVLNESISQGALIACVMLIGRITGPAQLAFMSRHKLKMMKMSINQFDRFMDAATEQSSSRLKQIDASIPPTLSFSQVTLRYSADVEPALVGVSGEISAGELVAVIGPSGSGKSSLLMTAMSVIEPQGGVIFLNGVNINQYDPESLRKFVAFSSAEASILSGTLRDNLVLYDSDATDDEIREALRAAGGCILLKALDDDLDRELFVNGKTILTALEGNYVTLARAILKKSKFMILDDPINNHNEKAKAVFIDLLQNLKGSSTVLYVTHDPDLIKQADKLIILDKGAVTYFGTPTVEQN
ncbi:MAG: ATP-binding cassette domain-containing protein [Psychromonas sp.]|nr:ATP-binding cassette domain-containing protein [Psychromonas sp.]